MTDEREPEQQTNSFKVWVEIEEVDWDGDHVEDHSPMLDGGAVAVFDTLEEAVAFGDRVQQVAVSVPAPALNPPTAKVVATGPTSATLACGNCGAVDDFGISSISSDWDAATCSDGFVEYDKSVDSEWLITDLICRACDSTNSLPEGWSM